MITCLLLAAAAAAACGAGGTDHASASTVATARTGLGGSIAAMAADAAAAGSTPAPGGPPPPTACDTATGPRYFVGPGKAFAVPSQAAAVAGHGAVVVISAGDYVGDVAMWRQSNLTLCGAGGRARLFAGGKHAAGKGIWVISGSNVTVDSIEFHDARVPDRNGAGIRAEGKDLQIINAGFFDNENGMLGPNAGDLTIHRSEFARNGIGEHGRTHNIYVGHADKVTVTSSFFHEAVIGHNFKSRAKATRIEHSYFMDGPCGTASYQIDLPNGGIVHLRGNLLQKGPKAANSVLVSYGAEGLASGGTHTLTMVHNTLASTDRGSAFLSLAPGVASVTLQANVFAGNGATLYKGAVRSNPGEVGNVLCPVTGLTAPDNIANPNFWPSALGGCARTLAAGAGGGGLAEVAEVADTAYAFDAPLPFRLRGVTAPSRMAGALQSAP